MIVSIKSKPPASANRALKIWQSHLYYRQPPSSGGSFTFSVFINFFLWIFLLLHHLIWAVLPPVRPFVTSIRRGIRPLTSSTWEMMPISR